MSNNNDWNKPKTIRKGKINFRVKINGMKNRKKNNENAKKSKIWFFGSIIKKINRPLTRQMNKRIKP